MEQTNIDKLIPLAYTAVQAHLEKKGQVSRQYHGYIASFGASVIQSGMLAALLFNHNEEGREEQDRKAAMNAIYAVIKQLPDYHGYQGHEKDNLLNYYRARGKAVQRLDKQILDAATAIKLVLRVFTKTDEATAKNGKETVKQ